MNKWKDNILIHEDNIGASYACDYLVIGSGAGGSVSAALLAEKGFHVMILEEGEYVPADLYTSNVSETMNRLYRNRGMSPILGFPTIPFTEGCCVGGSTVINGGLIWRTPHWVLDDWEKKYGIKGYLDSDLEKHFQCIEHDLNVVKEEIDEPANLDSLYIRNGADQLGWKAVMVPRSVKNCINQNQCVTGCPSGAKQSMAETYIPRALKQNAQLISRCRAKKIIVKNGVAHKVIAQFLGGKQDRTIEIRFDKLVLAGGAVQTPHLLRQSRISKIAGQSMQFHINLKIAARFKEPVRAENGTIFTVQIQEFIKKDIVIMASNFKPHYLALAMSGFPNEVIDHTLREYQHMALYTTMIRSESIVKSVNCLGKNPLLWCRLIPSDFIKILEALKKTVILLFESGAEELYLPVKGGYRIKSVQALDALISRLSPKDLELITVHVMSSCPMGIDKRYSVVNPNGQLWEAENVIITDASVLPSNIGESPQGTIMAFAHEIISRNTN